MDDSKTPYRYKPSPGTTENPSITIGGWAYEDEDQMQFAFECSSLGFVLPTFDDFIDNQPDGIAKQELLDWRKNAFNAFKNGNQTALRGWLQAAYTNWRMRLTIDGIRPTLAMGMQYSGIQSKQGKSGAEVRWASRQVTNEIIEKLALSKEYEDWTAKELWPVLYGELDSLSFRPEEQAHATDWLKSVILYNGEKKRESITGKTFANNISQHRSQNKKKSR